MAKIVRRESKLSLFLRANQLTCRTFLKFSAPWWCETGFRAETSYRTVYYKLFRAPLTLSWFCMWTFGPKWRFKSYLTKTYDIILVHLPQNIWWNFWFTFIFIGIFHFYCDAFQISWVFWIFNLWHSLVKFSQLCFYFPPGPG